MAQTVKITPASGLLEFIGNTTSNKPYLQHDDNGNLTLTLQATKKFTVAGNLKVNGKVTMAQQTLTDGAAITWDFNSGANAKVTIAGARTLVISNMEAGDTGLILVKQDAAGSRTLTLPGSSSIVGGGSYTASPAAGATDVLGVYYDGTTYWWTIGYNTVTPPLTSVGITGGDFVIANSPLTANGNIGLALATVNSTVGTFGSATAVPVITVNAKGLVTAVSATNISIPTNLDSLTDVTITSAATNQLLQFNGSQWVNWSPNYLTQAVTLQDTPPAGVDGKLWWETDTGKLKVYYGAASAWVDALPMPDMTLYLSTAGGAISGDLSIAQTLTVTGNILTSGNLTVSGTISASGYNNSNWNSAYNDTITSAAVSGTTSKTLTLTQRDGGTVTATWTDIDTDTDAQTLSVSGSTLSISGGNSITLPASGISQATADGLYVNISGDEMTGNLYISPISANPAQIQLAGSNPELYVSAKTGTARVFINRQGTGHQATLMFTTAMNVFQGTAWDYTGAPMWSMGMTNNNNTNSFKIAYGDIYEPTLVALEITTANTAYFKYVPYAAGNLLATQSWVTSQGYITGYTETNTFLGDGGSANTHPGTDRIIFTGQLSLGAAVLGMPSTDNSNAILNINRHPGEYNSQLGFSSNGSMYYRSFSATAINNTQAWRQVWDSDTLTNLNQLTNGPGYITGITSGNVTTALGYTPYNATNPNGYITGYTETDTLASVTGRGATTSTTLTLAKVITTGLYGPSTGGNVAIWQYDASNTGYGIVYNEGSPDTLRIDVSGQALTGTPDFLVGADYAQVNGNTVWHAGNLTNLNQLTNGPGYITTTGRAYPRRADGTNINFYWTGQSGQPSWLWGSNNGEDFYVWNPSNFSVAYASEAKWISFEDGPRDLSDRRPNWNNRSVAWDFVGAGTAGGVGNYAGVMTFSPWDGTSGSTGDSSYQLAFINETGLNASGVPGLRLRNGIDSTWNNWYQVWHGGHFSQTNINNWNGAYGWGNHASAGYATQTYVNTAISNLIDAAPSTLDTLNELAAALGDDPNFATSFTTLIGNKVSKAGDTMTGVLTINTNAAGLILNRGAVSNYNGIYYSTANAPKWFIGMRENLGSNNHIHYSEELTRDILTLNVTNGNATVFGTITASNFSGSSSGTNTGDQTNISGNAATATNAVAASNLSLTSLGTASVNVNNGSSAVYRNENGLGGNLSYAPVLHLGGGDTMWQIQGDYYDSSTLRWRAGYNGTWYAWRDIIHSGNIGSQSVLYAATAGALTSMNISQFTNNSGYLTALPSHNHDDRYYTESESDLRFAALSHSHTFASLTSKPTTISGYGITDAITTGNIGSQSVNYATYAAYVENDSYYMRFHWSGQNGQPTWLWGGDAGDNMYVYDPSNFSVNYANSAGSLSSMNISQFTNNSGYLTSLPSHNHDDRYYTESEIDSQIGNRLYQARVNSLDVNAFNATGLYRGSTSGWSNRPPIGNNAGALLQIDTHPSDYAAQLFFDSSADRLYLRNAAGGSWGSWLIMFHTGNYTSYVPTLTGTGASGSWGISVTGSAGSVAWTNVSSRPTALSQFTNDLGNYGGWITGYTETIGTNNTSGVAGAKYQINDTWLRVNSDNRQFQIYGNARSIIYRTDGATNDHGGGDYPHIFYYGGSTDAQRIVIFGTDGDIYVKYAGSWLSTLLAAKSNTGHTHDDRYYTETESDARFLIGTTNPSSVGNFTISIGNNGTYSYVQSHSGQPLRLNPVGNPVFVDSTLTVSGDVTGSNLNISNWNTAYNKRPTAISFSGTGTKTLTLTQGDGSTLTASFSDIDTDTNTDAQTLTLNGSTLAISGGNSITLPTSGISQGTADSLYVNVSGDTMTGALRINGSTLGQELFAVDGTNGRLFTVTDDLSDSLYSVNTLAGLPVLEVFANNVVTIGKFGTNAIYVGQDGRVGFGTTDFSYTASDNSGATGVPTNNRLFVNGSIQLLSNSDGIVFGRGTSTYLKDEDLSFGWGGGWYMTDGTYLRVRGNKMVYSGGSARFDGNIFVGNETYYFYGDAPNAGIRTNGSFLVNGDIYFGTRGEWLSTYLNQAVRTDSSPTFNDIYANNWFRNNGSNEGLYNQVTTQHLSSQTNGYWDMSSTTSVSAIRFYTGGHVTSLRGHVYANSSNEIGFLNSAGNWGLRMDNNYNVQIYGTVSATNFSGSSSGTNTGDQTNISGNAATATALTSMNISQFTNNSGYIAAGSTVSEVAAQVNATRFRSAGDISQAAGNHALQIFADVNNDAFMAFHISNDYAVHFGLDDSTNRLYVGGWSDGTGTKYQMWDSRDFSSTNISNWNTAYGWGNHASAGYQAASTAITTSNIGSQSVSNASTAGGLAVHANRNNEANKIVRTDANGYIQAGWINTTSGAFSSAINKIYCSDDDYMRYQTPANFISNLGLITTSNIGSQSVNYAASAGAVAWTNVSGRPTALSQFTNDLSLGGAVVTIQDSAPAGTAGQLWWESDTGKLKVYYSSVWVDATPVPDMSIYYAKAGGSIDGDVTIRQTLTVVGNTLIQGVLTETSDISLKENILPLESSLDKLMKLNGVSFNKKTTPHVKEIGFIAQEVEEIIPDLVTETSDGIKTVAYSRVSAILVETIKEQQTQITELKEMVNILTKKINDL